MKYSKIILPLYIVSTIILRTSLVVVNTLVPKFAIESYDTMNYSFIWLIFAFILFIPLSYFDQLFEKTIQTTSYNNTAIKLYDRLLKLSISEFNSKSFGYFKSIFDYNLVQIIELKIKRIQLVSLSISALCIAIFIAILSRYEILILLIGLVIVKLLFDNILKKLESSCSTLYDNISENKSFINDVVEHSLFIRGNSFEKCYQKKYHTILKKEIKIKSKIKTLNISINLISQLFNIINTVLFPLICSILITQNKVLISDCVGVYAAFEMIMYIGQSISLFPKKFSEAKKSIDIINDFEQKKFGNCKINMEYQTIKPKNFKLKLNNLFFSYKSNEVFSNLNIELSSNEIAVITGKSGIGKTSFLDILSGFNSIVKGQIYLNNCILDQNDLFQMIAYNTNEFHLNTGFTIYENIFFGKKENNNYVIRELVDRNKIYNFIKKLPNGIHTVIEDEWTPSGGEIQKILLLRVLANLKPIVILDEPTSNLDNCSENEYFKILRQHLNNRIFILTSHKKSVIEKSDRAFLINDKKTSLLKNLPRKDLVINER